GDVEGVVKHILEEAEHKSNGTEKRVLQIAGTFSRQTLMPRMIKLLECQVVAETEIPSDSRSR
ncbi:MAG TPA: hypothetical protein VGJ66_19095, partial [Pyrinomonadaceae bacterium]